MHSIVWSISLSVASTNTFLEKTVYLPKLKLKVDISLNYAGYNRGFNNISEALDQFQSSIFHSPPDSLQAQRITKSANNRVMIQIRLFDLSTTMIYHIAATQKFTLRILCPCT